ncbi:MAG: alpha-N-arabinofuranosidase [Clostridia bacterium]|nr:alpha-N-arabinofuranosidase [Clostridia bacterium]
MKAVINTSRKQGKISKYIYGQFAEHLGRCIYEGIYVENENIPNINGMRADVVSALKELDIPVLRWPGGCFADDYHWRDGIGEKSQRPYMVNTNWGNVVENNHFGTHEFFELCEQLGTEPYICGNVGSGSVQEMRDWIEYITFDGASPLADERRKNGRDKPWKLKFFGVGNENWGCGGNMRPEYYSDLFRRYAVFIRNYGDEPIYKIAGGPNVDDTHWTEVLMKNIGGAMNALSLHNYSYETDWNNKGDSVIFDESGWYSNMVSAYKMKRVINAHKAVMDQYDPEKKIPLIVDEWGNWYDVMPGTNPGFLYQQNTLRDAVSGMLILHIFHENSDRVYMANIAQMVNVLQAMILTEGENMVLTPTYYLFKMMKGHMDGNRLDIDYDSKDYDVNGSIIPKISMSASEKNGIITVSVCNTSVSEDEDITLDMRDGNLSSVSAQVLTGEINAHNTFDAPDTITPAVLYPDLSDGKISFKMPSKSIAVLTVK